jgi:hypothetical protein
MPLGAHAGCKCAAVKFAQLKCADETLVLYTLMDSKKKNWCCTQIQDTEQYTNNAENLPIQIHKLMTEESGKSDVLDSTLSGGLCGVVTASGCRDSCN